MSTPVVSPSPDTKTLLEAVLEFLEKKGIKFSKDWNQVQLIKTEPDLLVSMFGYNTGHSLIGRGESCTVYSFTVYSKEESIEVGCRELTETIGEYGCTVYSALYSMLFDSLTRTPDVKKDGKGGCESIDLYEYLDWD